MDRTDKRWLVTTLTRAFTQRLECSHALMAMIRGHNKAEEPERLLNNLLFGNSLALMAMTRVRYRCFHWSLASIVSSLCVFCRLKLVLVDRVTITTLRALTLMQLQQDSWCLSLSLLLLLLLLVCF